LTVLFYISARFLTADHYDTSARWKYRDMFAFDSLRMGESLRGYGSLVSGGSLRAFSSLGVFGSLQIGDTLEVNRVSADFGSLL
jgi:hypothetical protein